MSRRWMSVTLSANFVRNMASSTAESPPPTTAISWPRKKKPSQVAHVDRPWPISRLSASSPSMSDWAPVDTMTVSARCSWSRTHTSERPLAEVDGGDLLGEVLGAEASGLVPHAHHQLRAQDALGEAGEVLDLGGEHELAARLVARRRGLALDHERRQVGPGGVDGGGEAGRAGADDDHVTYVAHDVSVLSCAAARAQTWLPAGPRLAIKNAPSSTRIPPVMR